jgi:hypothetical protein
VNITYHKEKLFGLTGDVLITVGQCSIASCLIAACRVHPYRVHRSKIAGSNLHRSKTAQCKPQRCKIAQRTIGPNHKTPPPSLWNTTPLATRGNTTPARAKLWSGGGR